MRLPRRAPAVVMFAASSTERDGHPGDDRLPFADSSHPKEIDFRPCIRPGTAPIPAHIEHLQSALELGVEPDAEAGVVVVTASLHLDAPLPVAMTVVLGTDAALDLALRLIGGVTRLRGPGGAR
jgi:hypothetical protein